MLDAELDWMATKLGDSPGLDGKDYIFGHCDLLSGNVIVQNESDLKHTNGHTGMCEGPRACHAVKMTPTAYHHFATIVIHRAATDWQ